MSSTRIIVPLASGCEEIEAVSIIDVLRRAGIEVTAAGVGGLEVTGSHGIRLGCDRPIEECDPTDAAGIVLPGGMPGTLNLGESAQVIAAIDTIGRAGGVLAAVCAAPTVLNRLGWLEGLEATSHPAHAHEMDRCHYVEDGVVSVQNRITSRGAGTAIAFAAAVVAYFQGPEAARDILERMVAPVS